MEPQSPSPLKSYLAERDAACPSCGYNLRGLTGEACPECGAAVRLELGGSARARGVRAMLLVLLGWVAVASAMGAWRAGIDASREALVGQSFVVQVGTPGNMTTRRIALPTGQPLTLNRPRVTLGQGTRATITGQSVTITTSPQTRVPALAGVPVVSNFFAAAPQRDWSAVSWPTWVRLGWTAALGLVGLAGLLVLALAAWRSDQSPGRRLAWLAGVAFGLYACGQIVEFARDVAG